MLNQLSFAGRITFFQKIKSFDSKYKMKFLEIFKNIKRVALHAETIVFSHPVEKKQIKISAPVPEDLYNAIKLLEKYEG